MRGKPDNNRQDFGLVAFILRQEGHTVFNPTEEENDTDLRIAFAEDFAWLCRQAEALVLLPGWHCSDGARGERWIAQALDLPIFIMEETNDECLSQIIRDLASYLGLLSRRDCSPRGGQQGRRGSASPRRATTLGPKQVHRRGRRPHSTLSRKGNDR